jgi:uncharacterized protein
MDFDWNKSPFELDGTISVRDIEESFEDPFAVKLLPDSPRFGVQARYFNLGKANSGVGIFSVYRANGRMNRVICARPFSEAEEVFYSRKKKAALES